MPDITNWTALFIALSPLVIALLRRSTMTDNAVSLLTVVVVTISFFAGRALDNALTWPLSQALAAQLAGAIVAQQALYMILRKTTPMQSLEQAGNSETNEYK